MSASRVEERRDGCAGPLGLARALLADGRLEPAARELARALESAPPRGLGSLARNVRRPLSRLGWTLRAVAPGGRVGFAVARAGDPRVLFALMLESAAAAGSSGRVSIPPAFRLRVVGSGLEARLRGPEKNGLAELSTALCLLLESLRARAGAREVIVRAEAHEGGREGLERILRITAACNLRCPFCFVPHARGAGLGELERELDELARLLGPAGTLVISGGEPTVDPRLPEILASARRRGIRRFILQTNGVRLAVPGVLERLMELGVEGFDVSFHSHRPGTFDRLTRSRGNHARVVEALGRLLDLERCRVTVCVLVNAWNYRELPQLVGFLGRLCRGRRRAREQPFELSFSVMNGAGMNAAPRMAVDLAKVAPYLRGALARCRTEGLRAQRFTGETAVPPCLVDESDEYAGEIVFSQERVRYATDFSGESGNVGRAKRPSCRSCVHDARCLGVPAEYARTFGLGALSCGRR